MTRPVAIALAVLFILLALLLLAVNELLVLPFDLKVAFELHEETNPVFAAVMTDVTIIGLLPVAIPLTLATAAVLLFAHRRLEAAFILGTGGNFPISSLLKAMVARARPTYDLNDASRFTQTFDSFPSGHAVFFMSFFGMLGYLAWRHLTGPLRWAAAAVCALLIILVGPSRVYVGAHWASDAVGGYLVGAIWLLILVYVYETAARRFSSQG